MAVVTKVLEFVFEELKQKEFLNAFKDATKNGHQLTNCPCRLCTDFLDGVEFLQ